MRLDFVPDFGALAELEIVCADDLTVERVRWLWPGYLPARKLTLFAGPVGVSKTTLALAVAATITQGGRWPDGSRAEYGSVLVWSGEDGIADTLLPRLIAHGAELSRVHFVGDVADGGEKRPFDPSADMAHLLLAASRIADLRMVMIDPVISTVRGDSNTNGDVRRGLFPLVKLGETTGAAVVGITHFSKSTTGKDPVERVTGSLAFAAAARVVLAVARMPEEQGGGRIVVRAKNNLGPDGGGYRFDIRPVDVAGTAATVRVEWGEAVTGTAHQVLAAAEQIAEPEDDDAVEFLRSILTDAGGSIERKELLAVGKGAGYSERALDRARQRAGIRSQTHGFGKTRKSVWAVVGGNGANGADRSK